MDAGPAAGESGAITTAAGRPRAGTAAGGGAGGCADRGAGAAAAGRTGAADTERSGGRGFSLAGGAAVRAAGKWETGRWAGESRPGGGRRRRGRLGGEEGGQCADFGREAHGPVVGGLGVSQRADDAVSQMCFKILF